MTNFQYYFQKLPCFNCKKTKVNTDLGWLTATMKDDVVAQATAIIAQEGAESELSVNVTCTKDEARDYLLLNFYGYSEEQLADQVKAEDEQEVADEIAELLEDGNDTAVFEHEIALQSCTDCNIG
jgi:IMP cyclohydrolase